MENRVIKSSRYVAERSRYVTINKERIKDLAERIKKNHYKIPPWEHEYHFFDGTIRSVSYLLLLDSINFCFWPQKGRERWKFCWQGEWFSGYYALSLSLKEAFQEKVPFHDPGFLETLSFEEFKRILNGRGDLQLMEERHRILNDLGRIINREFGGDIKKIIDGAGGSCLALVDILVQSFPFFRDIAQYDGEKICFYKRAQIFVADLYGAFEGRSLGYFRDIDKLSAFADYKLPQVLRHMGILEYSSKLSNKIDSFVLLEPGSKEEVEIRANTIIAVELIKQELMDSGIKISSIEIDRLLWYLGQKSQFRKRPYHRTITIFY